MSYNPEDNSSITQYTNNDKTEYTNNSNVKASVISMKKVIENDIWYKKI